MAAGVMPRRQPEDLYLGSRVARGFRRGYYPFGPARATHLVRQMEKLGKQFNPSEQFSPELLASARPTKEPAGENFKGQTIYETIPAKNPAAAAALTALEALEAKSKQMLQDYRAEVETILGFGNRKDSPYERKEKLEEANKRFSDKFKTEILDRQAEHLEVLFEAEDQRLAAVGGERQEKTPGARAQERIEKQEEACKELTKATEFELLRQQRWHSLPSNFRTRKFNKSEDAGGVEASEGAEVDLSEAMKEGEFIQCFSGDNMVAEVRFEKGVISANLTGLKYLEYGSKERNHVIESFVATTIATIGQNPGAIIRITGGSVNDMMDSMDRFLGMSRRYGGGNRGLAAPCKLEKIDISKWTTESSSDPMGRTGHYFASPKEKAAAIERMVELNKQIEKHNARIDGKSPEENVATVRVDAAPTPTLAGD